VKLAALLWLAPLAVACGDNAEGMLPPTPLPEVTDTVAQVDPRIGTGGLAYAFGSCFVGAAAPHGLVKLGPDTNGPYGTVNFLHFSGYFAEDDKIQGFSHVHLHGAGATDYGVLSLMPVTAFDPSKTSVVDYQAKFAKADEHASAGRYAVALANGIGVELTATERAGVHHYTGAGAVVIDLAKTLSGGEIDNASISAGADEITGQLHHFGGMSRGFGGYTIYFAIKASAPWSNARVWSAGQAPSNASSATGTGVGAAIDVPADITLAVGISLVSLDGARANLADVGAIDFGAVVARTQAEWAKKLDTVKITGGTEAQRRIFYTSLYHAFLMPTVVDDVASDYQLVGMNAPATATGYRQMSDASLWDTYRTVAPLYAWLAPDSARDQTRSLVGFGTASGQYPRWPLATGETGTMIGASAEIVIADAVARGVPDAGGDAAWDALRAAAMDTTAPVAGRGGRNDIQEYLTLGYVPATTNRSVSSTTEYAHDDFALANLAGALGHTADHDALLARREGWRKLYDPSVGFLRAKNADGTFPTTEFDPLAMSHDYAEANAWHSLWMAGAHDPEGLSQILGGNDAAVAKLVEFFTNAKTEWEAGGDDAGNFPPNYYWHGNEPDINAAFLFSQLGRTDLANQWQRWIADTHYSDQPDGVAGNDDGGTLGSWYVLQALGVYPIPGSDRWVLAAPAFPQARVVVGGHELVITADGISDAAMYVKSIEIDGQPVDGVELTHAQLAGASTLKFTMATAP
jgi:predicted alpha-1,2-mannosidase